MCSLKLLSQKQTFKIGIIAAILLGVGIYEGETLKSFAQNAPTNPLEMSVSDPLLPPNGRPLSPLEKRRLRQTLDQLNTEARAKFDGGDPDGAFQIWYRELKLRRYLSTLEEIDALGRVGEIAWKNSRTQDVKNIYERLVIVQKNKEQNAPLTPELLEAFATAYQKIHKIDESLDIWQKVLANARKQEDIVTKIKALNAIGDLHLARFDYGQAAPVYEELLDISQQQKDLYQEGIYLQKLAEIYKETLQPQNAIKIKEKMIEGYLQNQQIKDIPDIKILIGEDYEALKMPEQASQNYQEAYSLAWSLQQFSTAGMALTKLGDLYRKHDQEDYALQIYQQLIKVEQQSYNYYGLMRVYDKMGDIYFKKGDYQQAIASFQQGLQLARSIAYNEAYFLDKIAKTNEKLNPSPTDEIEVPTP